MQRNLVYASLFILSLFVASQEPSHLHMVGKAVKSASDIVAVKDVNGRDCAAIKVLSDMDGFSYNANNEVVRVDDGQGEDIVYLMPDERVLYIYHSGYTPLQIILNEAGIRLEPRKAWVLKVIGDKKASEVSIGIITNPPGAEVFIDGINRGTGKQHTVTIGSHELQLVKTNYQTVIQTINPDEKNTLFEFNLKLQEDVNFQVDSDPRGAVVFLDGVKLDGKTLVNVFYPPGRYNIRLEKEWYVPFEEYIDIQTDMGLKNYKLQPDFATLTVTSAPQSGLAIILNNGPQNANTPYTFDRLSPGLFRVRAKSDLYETDEQEVQLEHGDKKIVSLTSGASFATLTIKTLPGATVYLNGKKIEQLQNIRLETAIIMLRAEMNKARPTELRVVLKKGDVQIIELMPQVQAGTIQVAAVPMEAKIELRGDAGEYYTAIGAKSFANIPVGTYILEVSQAGYPAYKEAIVLQEGKKINKSVALEKSSISTLLIPTKSVVTGGTWNDPKKGIEFILIEGGTFNMGDTFGDGNRDEKPAHSVTVSDFYLGKTEVTVAQYRTFCQATGRPMPTAPSWGWQDNHPIVNVSWNDAIAFCKFTSCRLPTEAEWEYAAREGGRKVRFGNGKDVADPAEINFDGSAQYQKPYSLTGVFRQKTTPVASFAPNSLGLFDISGNVWEWCHDWYSGNYYSERSSIDPQGPSIGQSRVLRGGSWSTYSLGCRTTFRDRCIPDNWYCYNGFRVARSVK